MAIPLDTGARPAVRGKDSSLIHISLTDSLTLAPCSGMAIYVDNPDFTQGYCGSSFTSLRAYAPLTVPHDSTVTFATLEYWWTGYINAASTATGRPSYSSVTLSRPTLISSGFAIADPINIAWAVTDLPKFPPAYASSLAKKIGVPFTPTGTAAVAAISTSLVPGLSSNLPRETDSSVSSGSGGLSTGAKAGIGAVVAVAVIIGLALLLLCLRRRRKHVQTPGNDLPEMVVEENSKAGVRDEARRS